MEDSVIGMSGGHVRHSVEEEIRQDQEDATIHYLNSVDWIARVTTPNANVVTWTHAHLHVLLKQ